MLGELSLALTHIQQFHQGKSAVMESRAWIVIHLNVAKEQVMPGKCCSVLVVNKKSSWSQHVKILISFPRGHSSFTFIWNKLINRNYYSVHVNYVMPGHSTIMIMCLLTV